MSSRFKKLRERYRDLAKDYLTDKEIVDCEYGEGLTEGYAAGLRLAAKLLNDEIKKEEKTSMEKCIECGTYYDKGNGYLGKCRKCYEMYKRRENERYLNRSKKDILGRTH